MVIQATQSMPRTSYYSFVLRTDMAEYITVKTLLANSFKPNVIVEIKEVTNGQATSAMLGLEKLVAAFGDTVIAPITCASCDSAVIYDNDKLQDLLNEDVDLIVWGVRGYANAIRQPQMYGWLETDQYGVINKVGVKKALTNPNTDPIIIGTFTFKSVDTFERCYQSLLKRNGVVNGEFYLDSCIEDALSLGLKCKVFEVENYISWGTPNELRTFEYWQSCFHKWDTHPYCLEDDPWVDKPKLQQLTQRFAKTTPALPQTL
jgi:hypothetical protein